MYLIAVLFCVLLVLFAWWVALSWVLLGLRCGFVRLVWGCGLGGLLVVADCLFVAAIGWFTCRFECCVGLGCC